LLDIIRTYVNLKVAYLNTQLTDDLTETTASLDLSKLPANQLHRYYEVRLDNYKRADEKESQVLWETDAVIKLTFGVYKKNIAEYASIVDTYIHALMRLLKARNTNGARLPYTSSSVTLAKIVEIDVKGLREIVNENYLQPEITIKFLVIDNS